MLHLNFLEIETNKNELSVLSKTYNGNWEQYKKIQSDYPNYFFYLSHGRNSQGSKIFAWKISKEATSIKIPDFYNEKINSETTATNPLITAHIHTHTIFINDKISSVTT